MFEDNAYSTIGKDSLYQNANDEIALGSEILKSKKGTFTKIPDIKFPSLSKGPSERDAFEKRYEASKFLNKI